MKHILITGEIGAGKSTLIRRLLLALKLPVYGFVTRRLAADESGFHPVYIHPASLPESERLYLPKNLAASCDSKTHNANLSVFNTLGAQYIRGAKPDGVIVMDELGFLESHASEFTNAVFDALRGSIPVIAAVKARDVPFLNAVRAFGCRENAALYTVIQENRDSLFSIILQEIKNEQ